MDETAKRLAGLSPVKRQLLEQLLQNKKGQPKAVSGRQWGRAELPVVTIQPAGSRLPLFCVAPAGGSPLCYVELARHLGPQQPVFGLQSQGLLDGKPPLTRVSDMAELYIRGMRTVQPAGPYFICGWSFGAVVAFEMARQLERQGVPVGLLVQLDGGVLHSDRVQRFKSWSPQFLAAGVTGVSSYLMKIKLPTTYQEVRQLAQWVGVGLPASPRDGVQRDLVAQWKYLRRLGGDAANSARLFTLNTVASINYEPGSYSGRVTLFRTPQEPSEEDMVLQGARRFSLGGVDVHPISGNHLSLMLEEEHLKSVASRLGDCLIQAQPRDPS